MVWRPPRIRHDGSSANWSHREESGTDYATTREVRQVPTYEDSHDLSARSG